MKRFLAACVAGVLFPALAIAAPPAQCPFSPDELKAVLGQPFKAGVPEAGIVGKACTYRAGDIKLWLDAGAPPMPVAQWRKISAGPGTTFKPVAGDPDKAVHESPGAGVSPYPALSYERGGYLVNITVTGVNGKPAIDAWNAKLVKLRRIP